VITTKAGFRRGRGDGEFVVHRFVLEVLILREHAELRIRHLNERLGRQRRGEKEGGQKASDDHGFRW
jgi:hypothetical protein